MHVVPVFRSPRVLRVTSAAGVLAAAAVALAPVTVASEHGSQRRAAAAAGAQDRAPHSREHPDRLAGRAAGVGRERPGRPAAPQPPDTAPVVPESSAAQVPPPESSRERPPGGGATSAPGERPGVALPPPASARPEGTATARRSEPAAPSPTGTAPSAAGSPSASTAPDRGVAEQPTGRMLRVLPLGTGFVLMGIGLGVIGLRVRRRP